MTASRIGAVERGEIRRPNADYRTALRTVVDATARELGFHIDGSDPSTRTRGGLPWGGDRDDAIGLVLDALTMSADRPIVPVRRRALEFVDAATDMWGAARQIETVRDAICSGTPA